MNTDAMTTALLAIVGGIIGLAVISVLVSPKAQTPTVLSSAGGALSNVITAAVAPVTGSTPGGSSNSFLSGIGNTANLFGSSGISSLSDFASSLG